MGFFHKKPTFIWVTLGLIEGEITPLIDKICENYPVRATFRWRYPYLEIKINSIADQIEQDLIDQVGALLKDYTVSLDNHDAFEVLKLLLPTLNNKIFILNKAFYCGFKKLLKHPNIIFVEEERQDNELFFSVIPSASTKRCLKGCSTVELNIFGFVSGNLKFQDKINIPNRGEEVMQFINAYIAWKLSCFINLIKN